MLKEPVVGEVVLLIKLISYIEEVGYHILLFSLSLFVSSLHKNVNIF